MTTILTITGTGVPHPSPGRAGPGALVECGDVRLQFDAGRATVLRLVEAGVRAPQLTALFVTHHHSDHLTGLTDLLFARWLESHGRFVPLPVVAPDGPSVGFLERMMDPWEADIAVRAEHVGRDDHPAPRIVVFDPASARREPVWESDDGSVRVTARSVHHEPVVPAVAYRVDTPDGSIVISGDTIVCDEVAELASGVDVVVHEAMRRAQLLEITDLAPQIGKIVDYHADTVELGELLARTDVPKVVLTHFIPAPGSSLMGPVSKQDFVDDVRAGGFTGEVIAADDLTRVVIGADEPT